jgi:hypothetical protein
MPCLYGPPMPRGFAVVVSMVLALVAGLALIFVAWPGWGSPWERVGEWVMAAMAGQSEAIIVVGVAGSAAVAILVATVWLSRQPTDEQPG